MNTQPNMKDDDDDEFEIEVVDDTPPEDQGRPRRPEGVEPEIPDDDEIASYSEGVQKRIKKLRYEFHEERRAREAAEREREEAIKLAQRERQEAERLRQSVTQGESLMVEQAKRRVAVQIEQAQNAYKAAYEAGDSDALVKAQTTLTELKNEEYRLKSFKPAPAPQAQQQPQAQPQGQPQQQPAQPKMSEKTKQWAERNPWFGRPGSEDMTAQAFVAHEKAIREGVAPESDEYYNRIDQAVRRLFPDRFEARTEGQQVQPQRGVVVAPTSRSTGQNPRKITLTQTQVSIAKRLGLSLEQYAAQLLKENRNG